ncbi:MAG: SLC13 family permease [Bacteroidales bacterium]
MTALGALIGLLLSIFLIIRKISPAYSLISGALIGGLLGGFSLVETVNIMIDGIKDVSPAIIRILTAGVLSGVLIKTGAAMSISDTIIRKLGEKHVFLALALATMLLCAIGVFIDVAVITVAPVALSAGNRLGISKSKLLLMMIGGGKCGNIISPNPNTIIAAENFNAPLSEVMFVNLIPALLGLVFTVFFVGRFFLRESGGVPANVVEQDQTGLPSFLASITAPVVTIALLACRPLFGVIIDPLVALPLGGIAGIIVTRRWSCFLPGLEYGLQKMSAIAILLIGTGTIAGIIKNSTIKEYILDMLSHTALGDTLIAPVAGALMSAATASTTAGATIASASFSGTILAAGISAVWGAAMINAGATVLDHLPHGSFFHATAGAADLDLKEGLKLIPLETLIGLFLTILSVCAYLILH